VQSSSPSYLLIASLDAARAAAAAPGAFDEALAAAAAVREAAGQMARLQVLANGGGAVDSGQPNLDPLKLTIGVAGLGISGGHHWAAQCAG
jgi:arginine decarboxylase